MAATDIVSLDEAKTALNITTDAHDPVLEQWVSAISELVDAYCGPVVIRTVTDEYHDGGRGLIKLKEFPVASLTTVTEYSGGTATVLTEESLTSAGTNYYQFDAEGGMITRRSSWGPAKFGAAGVLVTYEAGRYADTDDVGSRFKTAADAILRRLWARETPNWVRGSGGFADLVPNPAVEPGTPGFFRVVQPVIVEQLEDQQRDRIRPVVA